jgi:phenylpropionate dioxygenase-like ring-hydroxylating dioxygenase large terminal subunit
MLSAHDNATLTQVGPGTPMGNLFRRFWLPVMLPAEMPSPDSPPVRIRVLGEDLIAFRETSGAVGMVANACPHRGASMFFGRNEEHGLRCVYHGWKFDTTGACVDMPSEPAESNFKSKVRIKAYPAQEYGGAIWVYMGPSELEPELPQIEWALVPPENRFLKRWVHDVNYAQALEGDIDTAHVPFLHRTFNQATALTRDTSPTLHIKDTDFGFSYGGRRHASAPGMTGQYNWRITQMYLPSYSQIPGASFPRQGHCYIPIDDEHTNVLGYSYNAERPLTQDEIDRPAKGLATVPRIIDGTFAPVCNRDNDYLMDREMQRSFNYTGIKGITEQDMAMTQSMGAIYDRTHEHLGTSDVAVIHFRRLLLTLARDLEAGKEPHAASHGEAYRARAIDINSPIGDFETLVKAYREQLVLRGGPIAIEAVVAPGTAVVGD